MSVPSSIENYQFKVDLRVSTSRNAVHGSAGVVFRYQDDKNYYRFIISRYCSSLIRVKGGVQERLMTKYGSQGGGVPKGTSGRESEWVTVGVTVESNDITITVDYAYDEEYNECDKNDPKKCQNFANSHKGAAPSCGCRRRKIRPRSFPTAGSASIVRAALGLCGATFATPSSSAATFAPSGAHSRRR